MTSRPVNLQNILCKRIQLPKIPCSVTSAPIFVASLNGGLGPSPVEAEHSSAEPARNLGFGRILVAVRDYHWASARSRSPSEGRRHHWRGSQWVLG